MNNYLYFVPDDPNTPPAPLLNTVDFGNATLNALAQALHGAYPLSSRFEYGKLVKLQSTPEHVLKRALWNITLDTPQRIIPPKLAGDIALMLRYLDVEQDHLKPLLVILYPELEKVEDYE